MKEKFVIQGLGGSKTLQGEISVNGAKNAALKAMAASLLFSDELSLKNVPDIEDVSRMEELLSALGVTVKKGNGTRTLACGRKILSDMPEDISKRFRASIVVSGPLLARLGKISFPHPGGCVIGARPIDLFLEGFQKMGATVKEDENRYLVEAPRGLRGTTLFFRNQSVGATETFMMAAVLAKGKTILKNCAMEPEITSLADFLVSVGAKIKGAGTTTIEIVGGGKLRAGGKAYHTPPDRLETGSFLILGALAAKNLLIKNCEPEHVSALIEILEYSGVKLEVGKKSIRVLGDAYSNASLRALNVKTHEYPGFSTDLQSPMVVYLTQTAGESLVFETIFEGRLNYTAELLRMGADITMWDANRVMIKGLTPLKGRELESPDIRTGYAFVIAGIIARGETVIHNVYYIDRGYATIEKRLQNIGVHIERLNA
ncbi:MAG: UDP-N-acetylglucosamine 1-carboxyvinyltransferase [Parcubacteria group bacterium]|nr:UDP-N-acetylglucosamine 1-carboxyvinyltransferase [Parcubacteria group bacterium]